MMLQSFKFLCALGLTITCIVSVSLPAWAAYRITLQPTISVSQEYTDNVNLLPDGFEESEWITVVSPSLALDVVGQTQGARLSYTPGFTYYAQNTEDSTIRHSAAFDAWKQLAKNLTLSWNNSFTRTEQPYSVE